MERGTRGSQRGGCPNPATSTSLCPGRIAYAVLAPGRRRQPEGRAVRGVQRSQAGLAACCRKRSVGQGRRWSASRDMRIGDAMQSVRRSPTSHLQQGGQGCGPRFERRACNNASHPPSAVLWGTECDPTPDIVEGIDAGQWRARVSDCRRCADASKCHSWPMRSVHAIRRHEIHRSRAY